MFFIRRSLSLKTINLFTRNMCSARTTVQLPIPVFGMEGKYVAALYRASVQMQQVDQVEKHLKDLQKELLKPKIQDFMRTSFISRPEKAKILQGIGEAAGMPPAATNFLAVVAENGRLNQLRKMINIFLEVMVAHRNEALCEVITAEPLDENTRTAVKNALTKFVKSGKKITITETVDPTIIGGIKVGIEDKYIDMSISRKLQLYTDLLKQSI